ncbi:hypothetical protein [Desulfocurvus sp.]|uniref:hypothetical protein n=1 Tax=Desulfocurvus sp. TaxID=2871698 RepID=UPI0025B852BE|nr:hypothetical protein [Desulfocurvus sp.]MCK9239246.1 hypothetical protein [Desulfocurvus sp.]
MKRFSVFFALAAALASLAGCETMDKTWTATKQTTQGYYKEYLNTDPTIDYEARDWTSSEGKLADLFAPVDKPLYRLSIALNRQDAFPEDAWVEALLAANPWLSGLAVATLGGEVVLQRPETALKPLNLAPALAYGQALADRRLRAYVDMTPLGPEIYLATGMFRGNELVGAITAHFDIRNVIEASPEPGALVVATPEDLIWAGSDDAAARAVSAQPWAEILAERSFGRFVAEGREYIWLCRFLGDHKIIYATASVEDDTGEESGFSFFGLF